MEARGARSGLCVTCRHRPVAPAWRPFCSERCKLLDLQNWLDGRYRIPEQATEPLRGGDSQEDEP